MGSAGTRTGRSTETSGASTPGPVVVWILAVLSFGIFYSTETVNGETQRRIVVPFGIVFGLWCVWLLWRASTAAHARDERLLTARRLAGVVAAIGIGAGILQTVLLSDWNAASDAARDSGPIPEETGSRPETDASGEVSFADACQLLTASEAEGFLGVPVTQDGPHNQTIGVEGRGPDSGLSRCTYSDPSNPSRTIAIFSSRSVDEGDGRTAKDILDDCPRGQRVEGLGTAAVWFDPTCTTRGLAEKELVIANERDYLSIAVDDQTTLEQTHTIAQTVVSRSTAQQASAP
jgi:hypothetical protein